MSFVRPGRLNGHDPYGSLRDVMEHLRGLTFAWLYIDLKRQKGVTGDPCSHVVEKDVRDYNDRGFVRVGMNLGSGERRTMRFRFEQGHW